MTMYRGSPLEVLPVFPSLQNNFGLCWLFTDVRLPASLKAKALVPTDLSCAPQTLHLHNPKLNYKFCCQSCPLWILFLSTSLFFQSFSLLPFPKDWRLLLTLGDLQTWPPRAWHDILVPAEVKIALQKLATVCSKTFVQVLVTWYWAGKTYEKKPVRKVCPVWNDPYTPTTILGLFPSEMFVRKTVHHDVVTLCVSKNVASRRKDKCKKQYESPEIKTKNPMNFS